MWDEALSTYDHDESAKDGGIPRPIETNGRYVTYDIQDEDWIHLLQAAESHCHGAIYWESGPEKQRCARARKWFLAEMEKVGAKPW
jgi:hypothetical protein